jgi:hypothetical protein
MANFRKAGSWNVVWQVVDTDGKHVAYFKDPWKAADHALRNKLGGVEMVLHKPEWNTKTLD